MSFVSISLLREKKLQFGTYDKYNNTAAVKNIPENKQVTLHKIEICENMLVC
jgi:hypothetical protein